MGSTPVLSFHIPTIDVGPFLEDPDSQPAEEVVSAVREACRKTGFFQVIGHGLPYDVQKNVLAAAAKLFKLPFADKKKLDASQTVGRRGYDVLQSQAYDTESAPDLKEGFWIGPEVPLDDPVVVAKRFFMGPNVWPPSALLRQDQFREPVEAYFEAIQSLAVKMLNIIERSLSHGCPIPDEFTRGRTISVLRLLHYPPMPPPASNTTSSDSMRKEQFGAGAHTDFGAITLLLQDGNAGLEVLNPETKKFFSVSPTENAFVFNVGDMLSIWTGGEYRSSVHRVINKAAVDRYSAAFFYDGALDCPLTLLGRESDATSREDVLTVEKHMIARISQSYGKA